MAIITTPGAGVSPYEPTIAAPTILRAGADGTTVSTSTAAAAATVSELAATNANILVVVSGQAALNSLITSSQPGVFEGANVTINLEEQNFNTTNQVTSNTNYPSGGAGEIQFNSGSNSFASNAYFTYDNSNVITPGIRTDGYFYSNGAPFIGGGNAAIGNFVFTGDTMSINDDANISLVIQGNSLGNNLNQILINPTSIDIFAFNTNPYSFSELYLDNSNVSAPYAQIIVDGNATPQQTWTFDALGAISFPNGSNGAKSQIYTTNGGYQTVFEAFNTGTGQGSGQKLTLDYDDAAVKIQSQAGTEWKFDQYGNLILPGNTSSINYANGDPYGSGTVSIATNSTPGIMALGNGFSLNASNQVSTANLYSTNLSQPTQHYGFSLDTNGVLHLPDQSIINGSTLRGVPGTGELNYTGITIGPDSGNAENTWMWVDASNAYIATDYGNVGKTWTFDSAGNLTLPYSTTTANLSVTMTNIGSVAYNSASPLSSGGSLEFVGDESNHFLVVPNAARFAPGTGDFTIEWYQYVTSDGHAWPRPFSLGVCCSNINSLLVGLFEGGSNTIAIQTQSGYNPFSGWNNTLNVWQHIAVVRSSGTVTIYQDGVAFNSVSIPDDIAYDTANGYFLSIGSPTADGTTGDETINSQYVGLITNMRYVVGTAVYTGNFTPSTDPLTLIPGTQLLLQVANSGTLAEALYIGTVVNNSSIISNGNAWTFGGDGNLTLPGNTSGINSTGNVQINSNTRSWTFGADGSTIFPTLTTQRGDNPSGTISGQTLLFGDATQEAIISTPDGSNASGINSQRLVINPGKGEDSNGGEGGDIYLWAGRGGANNGSGGDVKIRGGYAPADGTGGYIRMDGGASQANGAPGFIEITGGQGGTTSGGYIQITGGVGGSGTGGAVDLIGGFGQAGPGANVGITGGGSANGLAEYGNVNISSGASTWAFKNDGTTGFPNNTINPGNGISMTTRTPSSGNAYAIMYQSSNSWEAYAEDDDTGAYSAYAWIKADLATANTPRVFIENVRGNDGLVSTWTFDNAGNLTLPGNTIAINYANGNRITGNVTFRNEIVIGTGTSNLISGLYLAPSSSSADANMYLRVRGNINDEPTHIHFDTGNNQYYNQFIGDDLKYIQLANTGNIVINSNDNVGNSAQWTFGTNSILTLPGNSRVAPVGANIEIQAAAGGYAEIVTSDGNSYVAVTTGGAEIVTSGIYTWTFGNTGNLTTPGASGNISGADVITANVYAFLLGGNITEGTIPAYTSLTGNTIVLTPSGGTSADQQLVIYPTTNPGADANHLHLTSGNLYNTELFLGDDFLYVKLANTGNVVVNTNDLIGNSAQWTFDTTGNLTFPTGNLVIIPDDAAFGNAAVISSADHNLITGSFGANGGTSSLWVEDIANIGTSNIAAVYANPVPGSGNVRIAAGTNGGPGPYLWDFQPNGNLTAPGNISTTGNITGVNNISTGTVTLTNGAVIKDTATYAVAFGKDAGLTSQGQEAVAVGHYAGRTSQGNGGVAIGVLAGNSSQGQEAVAVGIGAGRTNQGVNSVAIGSDAGRTDQGNNSIIINATGSALNQTTANTFTVAPVRNDVANTAEVVFYNTTSKEITYGNVISVTGNITGAYIFGNGSGLTGVGAASVPGQNILPTIQTITIADTSGVGNAPSSGQGYANVTVANVISVTEYGVIITSGTSSQKYATGALGNIPGTEKITFTTAQTGAQFTVFAYVTSNAGTFYSNSATGNSGICLLAGTQIALSDGSHKAIEDIVYTDKLLSWDFDRGCYAETTALWIKRSETGSQYNLLTFSDGTTLRTFDQHRIFNKQAGAFTYPMTEATPVGTITMNEHGQEITLTRKQVIRDTIDYYNVITDYHMNLFSDSVLTSCRFNNIYPITDMKFVKDSRTPRTRAEFANIPDRFFHGLRLTEQTADVDAVEWYVDRLMANEVSTQVELVS